MPGLLQYQVHGAPANATAFNAAAAAVVVAALPFHSLRMELLLLLPL